MILPCAVVRDLIPLYAEDLIEPETRSLMDEHLSGCDNCRQQLLSLSVQPDHPVETAAPMMHLKKQIRTRRWRAVLIAALFVFIAVYTCFYRATGWEMIPWQDGLIVVKGIETIAGADSMASSTPNELSHSASDAVQNAEDAAPSQSAQREALVLKVDSSIAGIRSVTNTEEDGSATVIIQGTGHRNARRGIHGETGELVLYPVPDRVIYGYHIPQTLLWGTPQNHGETEILPRLALNYYLALSVAFALIFGFLWFIFRNKSFCRLLRQIFLFPCACIIGHLLIKGTGSTYFMESDFISILVVSIAAYLLLTLMWQALTLYRHECS